MCLWTAWQHVGDLVAEDTSRLVSVDIKSFCDTVPWLLLLGPPVAFTSIHYRLGVSFVVRGCLGSWRLVPRWAKPTRRCLWQPLMRKSASGC